MAGTPPEPGLVKGCTVEELRRKGLIRLRLIGKPVGILALPDGRVVARELSCKHQGADLSAGDRRGTVVTCPRHGWEYDLATGECVMPQGGASLREHPTVVSDGFVWVALQAAPRDPDAAW